MPVRSAAESEYQAVAELMAATNARADPAPPADAVAATLPAASVAVLLACLEQVLPLMIRAARATHVPPVRTKALRETVDRIGRAAAELKSRSNALGLMLGKPALSELRKLYSDLDAHLAHTISTSKQHSERRHATDLREQVGRAWNALHQNTASGPTPPPSNR